MTLHPRPGRRNASGAACWRLLACLALIVAVTYAPVLLCGRMFGLAAIDEDGQRVVLDRHRLFESNVPLEAIPHRPHGDEQVAGGRRQHAHPGLPRGLGVGRRDRLLHALDGHPVDRRGACRMTLTATCPRCDRDGIRVNGDGGAA